MSPEFDNNSSTVQSTSNIGKNPLMIVGGADQRDVLSPKTKITCLNLELYNAMSIEIG